MPFNDLYNMFEAWIFKYLHLCSTEESHIDLESIKVN